MTSVASDKKRLCSQIYDALFAVYGEVKCPLFYASPFQLLVSVVLSAQCTDERVNKTVPTLFAKYPDSKSLAKADISDVEKIIKPIGLYHAKAKNIIEAAKELEKNFGGIIPDSIEELTTLPGVGRKTANVIISHLFEGAGFAVDTHVNRLLNRIGIVATDDPFKIEMQIRQLVVPERLGNLSLLLLMHGRNTCKARKAECEICTIKDLCLRRL